MELLCDSGMSRKLYILFMAKHLHRIFVFLRLIINVKYNHGNKEYGKDITFTRRTEFDDYEYYGVQVKYRNVSGGAQGEINELIQQAKDSFSMPYYDVYSRNKVRVSKVIIVISGRFTQNEVEKIIEGVMEYPLKNNLIFLDKEKIGINE